jgi:hypothetical protein
VEQYDVAIVEAPRDAGNDLLRLCSGKTVVPRSGPADHGELELLGDARDRRVGVTDRRPEEGRSLLGDLLERADGTFEILPDATRPAEREEGT